MNESSILLKAKFPGEIIMINQDHEIPDALELLRLEPLIGFDTETRPAFSKGEVYQVSLLQLATTNHALLFRLHSLKDFSLLKLFFENDEIIKVGVAIRDDIRALQKTFPFEPKGFVELSEMAKTHNLKNFGLKGMTEEVLKLTLSKFLSQVKKVFQKGCCITTRIKNKREINLLPRLEYLIIFNIYLDVTYFKKSLSI